MAQRTLRLLAIIAGASACADYGPGTPAATEPSLRELIRAASQTSLANGALRVLISRADRSDLPTLDTTVTLSLTDTAVSLSVRVPVVSTRDTFQLELRVMEAGILLFRGGPVRFTFAGPDNSITIPVPDLLLAGPSALAASVRIVPVIGPLLFATSLPLLATVRDPSGAVITGSILRWRALDGPRVTVDPLTGVLLAGQSRGTARVVAFVPLTCRASGCTGPADTITVGVIAPVASILRASGDNQTGLLGQLLPQPIRVRVLGSDQLPLSGNRVAFKDSAGGRFAADTVTTDAGGFAETRWSLSQLLGLNRAVASVVGSPGISTVFQATSLLGVGALVAKGRQGSILN